MPKTVVRDYVPAGDELTDAEKQRMQFSRDPGTPQPQATGITAVALGSAEAQVAEAMAEAKKRTAMEHAAEEESFRNRIEFMEGMLANQAVAYLQRDDISQHEREAFLHAEKAGKNRTTVLGFFGWS